MYVLNMLVMWYCLLLMCVMICVFIIGWLLMNVDRWLLILSCLSIFCGMIGRLFVM